MITDQEHKELLKESVKSKFLLVTESKIQDNRRNGSKLYFHIRTGEGKNIPHFHVFNIDNPTTNELHNPKKYFECCIELKKCKYFNHKSWMRPIINNAMKDLIISFIYSKHPKSKGLTIWQYFKNIWLAKYPGDVELRNMKEAPDYSNLITGESK